MTTTLPWAWGKVSGSPLYGLDLVLEATLSFHTKCQSVVTSGNDHDLRYGDHLVQHPCLQAAFPTDALSKMRSELYWKVQLSLRLSQ